MWMEWNRKIAGSVDSELPNGLSSDDKLLHDCGNYFIAEGPDLAQFYEDSLRTMKGTAPEVRKTQFIKVHIPLIQIDKFSKIN